MDVTGADLLRIREEIKEGWTLIGPEEVDPAETYSLALNKRTAFHPEDYLPLDVTVGPPSFLSEIWEVLDGYARQRTRACLYLDDDRRIPGCY